MRAFRCTRPARGSTDRGFKIVVPHFPVPEPFARAASMSNPLKRRSSNTCGVTASDCAGRIDAQLRRQRSLGKVETQHYLARRSVQPVLHDL